ncbi:Fungal specific transcription factor domain [Rhizoctonia solani]|uniref:Fungal specific transcription factor domain n=1 Tax=Rhizoctonia solani TaxID=456999 RepID=A0A8H8NUN4_9AGAM|nr:Fungal specific transcription factor domain [Rhizoctonia solani]QRW18638.1 Fungal specific transcription factor domain [Rhizoctonia solani]
MTKLRRSLTGCASFRNINSRKKCDETKPECQRCLASGTVCVYQFVQYAAGQNHRMIRTKPGPRNLVTSGTRTPQTIHDTPLCGSGDFLDMHSLPENSNMAACLVPLGTLPQSNLVVPGTSGSIHRAHSTPLQSSVDFEPTVSSTSPDFNRWSNTISNIESIGYSSLSSIAYTSTNVDLIDDDDDDDPEGIRNLLLISPTMDKNTPENTLPFVLHCYFRWAVVSVFEPRKVAYTMRNQIIEQFSDESSRVRTILIANIMNIYSRDLVMNEIGTCMIKALTSAVQENVSRFRITASPLVPGLNRQHAVRTLDNVLEVVILQLRTQPISDHLQSLQSVAPVFRAACPEPPGKPLDLTRIMLDSSLNLRHFAYIDILASMITAQPTCFQYEVPFSLDLCDRMCEMQDSCGLRWLYGVPDQFIMMLAWINSLAETPGASENTELIAWIEKNLPRINIPIDKCGDPWLRIGRTLVLECWRCCVLIYLYMVLCKADSNDPRVVHAHGGFMRLIRGLRSARHPNASLGSPILVAGVVAVTERDRDTLREKIIVFGNGQRQEPRGMTLCWRWKMYGPERKMKGGQQYGLIWQSLALLSSNTGLR